MSLPGWTSRHAQDWPEEEKSQLVGLVKELLKIMRPIKRLRDHHLAHSDARALSGNKKYKASLDQVGAAFSKLDEVLRFVEGHYGMTHFVELSTSTWSGGAESFVNMVNNCSLEHP